MIPRESHQREKNENGKEKNNNYIIFQPFRIDIDWLNNLNEIFNKNNKVIESSNLDNHEESSYLIERSGTCSSFLNFSNESINSNDNNNNNNQNEINLYKNNTSSSTLSCRISKMFQKYSLKSIISFKQDYNNNDDESYYTDESEANIMRNLSLCKNEKEAFNIFEKLWRNSTLCDLILIVDGHEYLAHRIVLAFHSLKFRRYCEMNKHEFVTRINLTETHPSVIRTVINYLYTREIRFNLNSIKKIIACAQELDLKNLIEMCQDSMVKYTKRKIYQLN